MSESDSDAIDKVVIDGTKTPDIRQNGQSHHRPVERLDTQEGDRRGKCTKKNTNICTIQKKAVLLQSDLKKSRGAIWF